VLAEQAEIARLGDGGVQALQRQRVFRAAVDIALRCADGVGGDGHALDQAVGVALDDAAVHEGPRVALVGVADHVFGLALGEAGELPLQAGGEAGAAAAPQPGGLHLGQHAARGHLLQHPGQGGVAVAGDGLPDLLGVDQAAVAQRDALLLAVERQLRVARDGVVVGGRLRRGGLRRQAADGPFAHHAATDQVLLDQARDHIGPHGAVGDAPRALPVDVDQRFARAHADAADAEEPGVDPAHRLQLGLDGPVGVLGAGGDPAGPHADDDACGGLCMVGRDAAGLFPQVHKRVYAHEFRHGVLFAKGSRVQRFTVQGLKDSVV
jgi:hypothetical protein